MQSEVVNPSLFSSPIGSRGGAGGGGGGGSGGSAAQCRPAYHGAILPGPAAAGRPARFRARDDRVRPRQLPESALEEAGGPAK